METTVTVTQFNPFNLLDPFNPFAVLVVFSLAIIAGIFLPRALRGRKARRVGTVLIVVIFLYYLVPNFVAVVIWFLVNKLHWIQ